MSSPWWVDVGKKRSSVSRPCYWVHFFALCISNCRYMRGRLTLEKVNAAINDMVTYAEANYQLIAAPKKNVCVLSF